MMKSLGKTPFLGRYREISIEYDAANLGVNVAGMTSEGFWEDIFIEFDVDNPESYAHGIYELLRHLYPSLYLFIGPAKMVETEGFVIEAID